MRGIMKGTEAGRVMGGIWVKKIHVRRERAWTLKGSASQEMDTRLSTWLRKKHTKALALTGLILLLEEDGQ